VDLCAIRRKIAAQQRTLALATSPAPAGVDLEQPHAACYPASGASRAEEETCRCT